MKGKKPARIAVFAYANELQKIYERHHKIETSWYCFNSTESIAVNR